MATEKQLKSQLDQHRQQIDVENFDVTLGELVRMAEARELIRAPVFQRKFRWKTEDESYLVESLLLGLPVPTVYVAANPNGTWEVVDGLQRISTLLHFMAGKDEVLRDLGIDEPLRLTGLSKLSRFNGYTHEELPTSLRLYFAKRALRITSLSDKSNPDIRFEVFERLNKGGVVLTPQEVRACVHRGEFAELLRELAEHPSFKQLVKLQKSHQNDGTREELVLKFFAYLENGKEYDGKVKDFLNNYMTDAASSFDIKSGRTLFQQTADELLRIIKGPMLREGYGNTPLNQFEAVMVAAGASIKAGKRLRKPPAGWLNDKELVKYSTKGTNVPSAFRNRNARAQALLSGRAK